MTRHDWSDDSFDWAALNDACDIVHFWSHRVGRFGGQIKEKFGTLRFYASFYDGWWPIHSLCKPGHVSYRWWRPLMKFEMYTLRTVVIKTGLAWLIRQYQYKIYRYAYYRAVKKHPHIRAEILSAADYPELLKGL
jgi:hypothetical protein